MNLIEELQWRGMLHDIIPETEEHFNTGVRTAYVGFDPTGDSLHIGHLVSIMLMKHLDNHGHNSIALIGGATAMIGDPSGKSEERNLLGNDTILNNIMGIREQLSSLKPESSYVLNNNEWFKNMNFLDFIRDIGKHIPIGYMMGKASVQSRIESKAGLSFTEFTYQLVQGYDFLHLFKERDCTIQIGGADQWGNMTTGTELIRRVEQGKAFGFTCPLITKADGTKFGKTESGAVWLDPKKTSPYSFYQFWLNVSDEDAEKYIKIFTMLEPEFIENAINHHNVDRGQRSLQKLLAYEVTAMVHGFIITDKIVDASGILFSDDVIGRLDNVDDSLFEDIFEGVDRFNIDASELFGDDFDWVDTLTRIGIFKSKREARDLINGGGFSINKVKLKDIVTVKGMLIIKGKYLLLQRGKKKYILLEMSKR
jgi:tyrosyl-tRNA synthetase